MGHTYKQTLGYANSQYKSAVGALEARLSHVDPSIGKIRDGSTRLKEALRVSKFAPPTLGISPGDELGPVAEYLKLAHSAQAGLPAFKSENDQLLATAKSLIDEGKGVMDQAQSLMRCR